MNISLQAKSNRKNPMRKKAMTEKERTSHYLKEIFKVKKIESVKDGNDLKSRFAFDKEIYK